MDYECVQANECRPVKLFLKDNLTFYYGSYKIRDTKTISFTDRRREVFPIDLSLIGLIQPVAKIIYVDAVRGVSNEK